MSNIESRSHSLEIDQSNCRLYLISPPEIELRQFHSQLNEALESGDVGCFQLRLKNVPDDIIVGAAETLAPLVKKYGIPFLINDRPDLAVKVHADGVHIGQGDASYEEARTLIGPDGIIGVTCHNSRHLAIISAEQGADYVAFGSFFPTRTKESTVKADINIIRWWTDLTVVNCVAIGGITPQNCKPIILAGANFLAVSSGVWDNPSGPGAAIHAYCSAMEHTPVGNQSI